MADLGVNTSLGVALSEIEKKVVQAEVDRDNLKTNLSNKGVNVSGLNKMGELIAKIVDITPAKTFIAGNALRYGLFFNSYTSQSYRSHKLFKANETIIRTTCEFKGSIRVNLCLGSNDSVSASVFINHKRGSVIVKQYIAIAGSYNATTRIVHDVTDIEFNDVIEIFSDKEANMFGEYDNGLSYNIL